MPPRMWSPLAHRGPSGESDYWKELLHDHEPRPVRAVLSARRRNQACRRRHPLAAGLRMTATAPEDLFDLVVVGGGVMGLFTAYHASGAGARVAVLEAGRIGDPGTASYGRTRSYRRDYLDPRYVRLADEAMRLWEEF